MLFTAERFILSNVHFKKELKHAPLFIEFPPFLKENLS